MSINNIGNQPKAPVPPKSQSNDTVGSLQRQREGLSKQLEAVKSKPKNSQAEQEAAVAQKQMLENQINQIDVKIQKASQQQSGTHASYAEQNSDSLQVAAQQQASPNKSLAKALPVPQNEMQTPWNLKDTGRMIDTYA